MNQDDAWWRIFQFALVGSMGAVVETLLLAGLAALGLPLVPAKLAGTEAGILHNFLWNDRWTFRGTAAAGGWLRRLGRFHVAAMGGLAVNLAVFWLLVVRLQQHIVAAIVAGAAVNFSVSSAWVWRRRRPVINPDRRM